MSRCRDTKQRKSTPKEEKKEVKKKPITSSENQISLSSRMKAFLIDTFLINMPIMYFTIYILFGGGNGFSQNMAYGWLIILGMNFLTVMSFWIIKGQTPGLKAYDGILVGTATRKKISFMQAFVRYMMTLMSILSILGNFLPFMRKDKKTLQDLLSNTYVTDINSQ